MAEYNIGASGEGVDDLARRMQQAAQSIDEMNRKEEQRRTTEERVAGTEEGSARVRTNLAQATRDLSASLSSNTTVLGLETQAINVNTTALERNLAARRSIAGLGGGSGGSVAAATARAAVPVATVVEDPNAAARLQAAQRALAAAEIARVEANRSVATGRQASGVTPQQLAPLIEQRELVSQQVAQARSELRAAQKNVTAQEDLARLRQQQLAETAQLNDALVQQRIAQQAAAQAATRAAATAQAAAATQAETARVAITGQPTLPGLAPTSVVAATAGLDAAALAEVARSVRSLGAAGAAGGLDAAQFADPALLSEASGPLREGGAEKAHYASPAEAARAREQLYPRPGQRTAFSTTVEGAAQGAAFPTFGTTTGGPTEPVHAPTAELAAYRQEATANAEALSTLAQRQQDANRAFSEAGAIYADTSTRLSRHGALTTEFIQSLARGEVTLGEFGGQMLSTIGKFSGWAVAGAAVYGVFGALKDLAEGATETQGAVQNLGRFIPGLGGPAGGGTGQIGHAEGALRDISTQFNLPIKDVANAMQVVARVYHNVTDAAAATRGVLAFTRLDQVPETEAVNYTVGISQALNFKHGQDVITRLVNPLNALQSLYGARVSQTLPAIARSAPAALAAGIDLPTLEAITALGVRSGQTGSSFGTAITRGLTRFAFTPASELTFREYGIDAQPGKGGDLINQVMEAIASRARRGQNTDKEVLAFSQALGGPQLGVRSFAPVLEQVALQPGLFQNVLATSHNPRRSYTEDLDAALSTVSERFKSIGITLQNFGSELTQAGLLSAITGVLDGFNLIAHATERLASPILAVTGVFNEFPHAVRDVIGAFLAFRAVRYLGRTTLGGTATQFLGRLPGVNADNQAAVLGTAGRYNRELLPALRQREAAAAGAFLGATADRRSAQFAIEEYKKDPANIAASQAVTGSDERAAYDRGLTSLKAEEKASATAALRASQNYGREAALVADMEGQLAVLKSRSLSYAQKALVLDQQALFTRGPSRDLAAEAQAKYYAVATGRGSVAGVSEAAAASSAAAAAVVGAEELSHHPQVVSDLADTVAASRGAPAPPPGVEDSPARLGYLAAAQGSIRDRLSSVDREDVSRRLGNFVNGPGLATAGLIGTQLVGGVLPGGVGNFVQNVGGTAFGGLLAGQLLGKPGLGLAAGLLVGGRQQGGLVGGVLGGVAGAATGAKLAGLGIAAAEALAPFDAVAPQFALPLQGLALAGGAALGFVFGSGGGSQPTNENDPQTLGQRRIRELLSHGTQAQQNAFITGQFQQDLADSLYATGNTQARGAAGSSALINNLVAQQELFGTRGSQGRGIATRQIGLLLSSQIENATQTPAAALQVIQSLTQAQSKAVTDQFTYGLSQATTPGGARRADVSAQSQFGALRGGVAQGVSNVQRDLDFAQQQLATARANGIQKDIDAAQAQVARYQEALTGAHKAAAITNAALSLQQQAIAQQAYSEEQQFNQSTGGLAAARAGGDRRGQLLAQQKQLRSDLSDAYTTPGRSAQQRKIDINNANAGLSQNYTAQLQQKFAEVQAQGQLLQSTAAPGDTVQAAQYAVQAATNNLAFIKKYSGAFDVTQLQEAEAALNQSKSALAQNIADQAASLINIQAQTTAAGEFGDALAQAETLLAGARSAQPHFLTAIGRAQGRQAIAQAQAQVVQAQQQRIQEQGQLAASEHPGDPVAQAQAQIALAQRELAAAHGYDQVTAAQTNLNNANEAYNQALVQRYQSLGALQASETPEPLEQLSRQIHATTKALGVAVGPEPRQQLKTQLNQQKQQYQSTFTSQQEATIQFMFDMMQIPASTAVTMLEKLRKSEIGKVPNATIQGLDELKRRFLLGLEQPLGGGTFDLAPGNIRLPTFADVANSIQRGRPRGLTHRVSTNTSTQINVYVGSRADVPAVADAIDRATSGHLRARLRAAGVR